MAKENETSGDRTSIPLTRALGLFTGILLVAGVMIGSGVFKKIIARREFFQDVIFGARLREKSG